MNLSTSKCYHTNLTSKQTNNKQNQPSTNYSSVGNFKDKNGDGCPKTSRRAKWLMVNANDTKNDRNMNTKAKVN